MIVIDIDAIRSKKHKAFVSQMILSQLTRIKSADDKILLVPVQPIYWFSKRKITIQNIKEMGLPAIGTSLGVTSVFEGLEVMIQEIDKVARKFKMPVTGKFRKPVTVITDRDFSEISQLGAEPLPIGLI